MTAPYQLLRTNDRCTECETILFNGINEEAIRAKEIKPICPFCLSIEDANGAIVGGATGASFYGCLYVDMLWIKDPLRHSGWGTKLMQEAERIGKEAGCSFATVNTMDWEALPFYQKLGYSIEFTRTGFDKDSKLYFLRKPLK